MPLIFLSTNVPKEKFPPNFTTTFAEEVSRVTKKPLQVVTVVIYGGIEMFRFGSTDPGAVVEIRDLQSFDDLERNKQISSEIINFVVKALKLNHQRINTVLIPEDPTRIGLSDGSLLSEKKH